MIKRLTILVFALAVLFAVLEGGCGVRSPDNSGHFVARMSITYYLMTDESDFTGTKDTEIRDVDCNPIATVPSAFSEDLCTEGSGLLDDGSVVNLSEDCACGSACSFRGTPVCFELLDALTFPWGAGSEGNALEPLRSLAADPAILPFGTIIYLNEWDGILIPNYDGIGGFTHDGCFRVDDVGFGITGNHFDFFAGSRAMFQYLEKTFDSGSEFDVYADASRCDHLKP